MKRRFTILTAVFALLVFMTPSMVAWGQNEATWDPSYPSNTILHEVTIQIDDNISATFNRGMGATDPQYYTNGDAVRMYGSNTLTITTSSNSLITQILINLTQSVGFSVSSGSYVVNNNVGTWTGDPSNAIVFTNNVSGQNRISSITVRYSTGGDTPQPTTYTVTFDAGEGTFVGNEDFPNANNTDITGGNHTLPTATPPTGYNFNGWTASGITTPVNGTYNITADIDFTASYSNADEHTYNFAGANNFFTDAALTTHPGSGSNNNVETIYYGDGSTFVASGTSRYFSSDNSGYFLLGKSGAQISLPTFEGYKITQVKLHSSSGHSTSVAVSIVSGSNTASTAQTWSTKDHDYVYDIASDYQTSVLSVNVANGYNTQFTSITLVCEADVPSTDPSITASNVEVAYNATSGIINYTVTNPVDGASVIATSSTSWIGATFNYENNSVTFSVIEQNPTNVDRQGIITLTYGDNLATKDVTVTQDAAPVIYTTIPALFEAATSTATNVTITFGSWVVSAVKNSNVYLTDNQGHGLIIYASEHGFEVNDVLTGTASCKLQLYRGSAELTELTASTDGLTIAKTGSVVEQNIAINELGGVNTGALLAYEGLTYNGTALVDGNNNMISPYSTLYTYTFEEGHTYNVKGIYLQYNTTKELLPRSAADIEEVVVTVPSITVNPDLVEVDAEEHDGTLIVTYQNMGDEIAAEVVLCDADGEEASYEWLSAELDEDNDVHYHINANDGEARTAYFKVYALDANANDVYSDIITISQAAYVAPVTGSKYVKVTSVDDFTDGQYLIVYEEDGLAFDGSLETLDAVGNTITVAINNNEIAVTEATSASEFTINTTEGTSTIKSASGYYIGRTASSNGMNSSASEAYTNTISLIEGNAVITSSGGPTLRFNDASNQNRFRYYASGQKAIQLYKKVEDTPTENYTLEIEGYGSSAGGYYLIASPVTVNPGDVEGMTEGSFDLYSFNQSAENEWENWKDQNTEHYHFDLVPGKGYLYAHQIGGTFTLTGTPYNGNGEITLIYDANANLAGWNLIGNPFGVTATVDHDYYVINDTGEGEDFIITSKETPVAAMQGLFVVTEGTDDNKAIFTTEEPETPGEKLVLNVSRNRGIVDRAMIRFGEGHQMPKAMLNENHTKLYIPQANNEYAVVRSDNESEMPINFKAAANGTYTISIDADNVEMDYLHLFDNMTGNDVDLLATPSYTFEANTTDYANRFKLVYKNTTSIEENGETFAYFNGENMIITNEGDAQLQVIDMTGRIVSTETINGNATVKVNAAPGVYMLRLVNGNDIKTQKVIIK